MGVYKGVTTSELDELAAETAASLTATHPDYALVRGMLPPPTPPPSAPADVLAHARPATATLGALTVRHVVRSWPHALRCPTSTRAR